MRKRSPLRIAVVAIGSVVIVGAGCGGGGGNRVLTQLLALEKPSAVQSSPARETQPFGFPLRTFCPVSCPGDRSPSWSPDGKRIVFMRARSIPDEVLPVLDLMSMDANGRRQRLLAPGFGFAQRPLWSPDGRTLLLACADPSRPDFRGIPHRNLCTVDTVRAAVAQSTMITRPVWDDVPFDWSPDGRRIIFGRETSGGSWCCDLWTARPDGSDLVLIGGGPDDAENYVDAAWSRDGRSLAFITNTRTTDSSQQVLRLWVADADGRTRRVVAQLREWTTIVGWSSDGQKIYLRMQTPYPDSWSGVAVVDTVSGDLDTLFRRRTGVLGLAELSPDRTKIGFVQGRLITIANADGSGAHVVARGVSPQVRPRTQAGLTTYAWSPDSRRLVFVSDGECPTLLGLYAIGVEGGGSNRLTQPCRIVGTARADDLEGTERTNAIYGLGGNDRIRAGRHPDYVHGGRGADRIDGGRGDDRLYGGSGRDVIGGGEELDAIMSRDGEVDRIRCGPGEDVVWADRVDTVAGDCELVIRN